MFHTTLKKLSLTLICIALFSLCWACSKANLETEEGTIAAINEKVKLDKVIEKLNALSSQPEKLKPYLPALAKLYADGSAFDREVISILAAAPDPELKDAYIKAANSDDAKQIISAAIAAKEAQISEVAQILTPKFDSTTNAEAKRSILEIGLKLKDPNITTTATKLLQNHTPEDAPIGLLRTACNVLEFQETPASAQSLLKAMFYADGAGRSLMEDCKSALLNLRTNAIPLLIEAFKLENQELNDYAAKHLDRITEDTIRLTTANTLARLLAKDAIDPIIDVLESKTAIVPPGPLALKTPDDTAWIEWSALVGSAGQELILALNDIGIENNERAKTVLLEIYKWNPTYADKYKRPISQTGANNIEVSLRVNAAKTLLENNLLSDEEIITLVNTLKDPSFNEKKGFRPAARASIAQDLITYLAIASKPGHKEKIWQIFNEMKEKEFQNDPKSKTQYDFQYVIARIDAVKSTFEMADECQGSNKCFEKYLDAQGDDKNFLRIKAAYELANTNDNNFFKPILDNYGKYDPFGQMYATKALVKLGSKDDIPAIEKTLEELRNTKDTQFFASIKNYLAPLKVTLTMK